jgi:hypothetical protein
VTQKNTPEPCELGGTEVTVEDDEQGEHRGPMRASSKEVALKSRVVYCSTKRKATQRAGVQHAQQKGFSEK